MFNSRPEGWIPPFLNPGSGVSEGRGGLVFHMALLNGEFENYQTQHVDTLRTNLKPFFFFFISACRAINRYSKDKCHPTGLVHADMGRSGAEVPSTFAASHGGMCGSHDTTAAA